MFGILCVVWGTTWLALKVGALAVPPGLFAGTRWTVAGLVLLLWRHSRGHSIRPGMRLLRRLAVVAVLMISLNAVLNQYSLRYVDSGLAAVINAAMTPLSLLGFSVAVGQERFSLRQAAAMALGICGILLLFGPGVLSGRMDSWTVLGVFGLIVGCLTYSAGSVLSRPLMRTLPPAQLAAMTNFIGGLILLAASLAFEPGARQAIDGDWGAAAWAAWLFLLLPGSLGATIIYFVLVQRWGASRAGTYAFVSPVVAVLLGIAVMGESPHLTDAAGMLLMLAAAALILKRPAAPPRLQSQAQSGLSSVS